MLAPRRSLATRMRPLALAAALVCAAVAAHTAFAQTQATKKVEFDMAAQPLDVALRQIAEAHKLQVVFAPEDLKGVRAGPLKGSYTPIEAITKLASDAGLGASFNGQDTVVVKTKNGLRPAGAASSGLIQQESAIVAVPASGQNAGAAIASSASSAVGDPKAVAPEEGAANKTVKLAQIEVTGTRIRGAVPVGSELVVLDAKAIDQSGRRTVADLVKTLPQNATLGNGEGTYNALQANGTNNYSAGTGVNLRGLGVGSTLTLINGRRMAAAGQGSFVDISQIPMSALARVEVLLDGASAD